MYIVSYYRALPKLEDTEETDTAQLIVNFLEATKPKLILDAGSGSGYFSKRFGKKIISLDIDPERLKLISGKKINASITDIPLKNESVDAVVAKDVIEHVDLQDAFEFLHEARRILRVGGFLLITTLKNTQQFWDKPDHIRPYSNKWIARIATKEMSGFKILQRFDLPRGIPGIGILHLEWLTKLLVKLFPDLSDHGLIILQKL